MKRITITMIASLVVVLGSCTGAQAWDVVYNAGAGLLPTAASPAWQTLASGSATTINSGVLHINGDGTTYGREAEAIGSGVPMTLEARMRVSASAHGSAGLSIGTYSGYLTLDVFPDHMVIRDQYYQQCTFDADFITEFHTIRLAYDGNTEGYVWVDGLRALSWTTLAWPWTLGPPDGVRFGSYLADSYWQYVAYSKEFIPVPEPSSLAALLCGLAGVGGVVIRRRR